MKYPYEIKATKEELFETMLKTDKEIERLKESEEYHRKGYAELYKRIDEAIEYIEKSMNNPQPFYEYIIGDENGNVQNLDKLLDILKGVNENE